jgi:hypothetical protein
MSLTLHSSEGHIEAIRVNDSNSIVIKQKHWFLTRGTITHYSRKIE